MRLLQEQPEAGSQGNTEGRPAQVQAELHLQGVLHRLFQDGYDLTSEECFLPAIPQA